MKPLYSADAWNVILALPPNQKAKVAAKIEYEAQTGGKNTIEVITDLSDDHSVFAILKRGDDGRYEVQKAVILARQK